MLVFWGHCDDRGQEKDRRRQRDKETRRRLTILAVHGKDEVELDEIGRVDLVEVSIDHGSMCSSPQDLIS